MDFKQLVTTIDHTHHYLQQQAVMAVNRSLTLRNWIIGYHLVEYEQHGLDRAKYGQRLMEQVAEKLDKSIKGINGRYLRDCRQFYNTYGEFKPVVDKLDLPDKIWGSVTPKLKKSIPVKHTGVNPQLLIDRLSYTHLLELTKEKDPLKRTFYQLQAMASNWSIRELERQRGSLLFERTGLSKNKKKLLDMVKQSADQMTMSDLIRDPYVFEFAGLWQREIYSEGDLEKALLDHIQQFLLELGKGFCFEARQKRITIDQEHHYIDLVFYHRILKCHVIVELKTRKFLHADAGQMNFYLSYFEDCEMSFGDNPPIGILLCTEKGEATVKYATAGISNKVFVSRYRTELPSEDELRKEIEREKRLLEE